MLLSYNNAVMWKNGAYYDWRFNKALNIDKNEGVDFFCSDQSRSTVESLKFVGTNFRKLLKTYERKYAFKTPVY